MWLFSFTLETIEASASSVRDLIGAGTWVLVVDGLCEWPCHNHVLSTVSEPKALVMAFVFLERRLRLICCGRWGFGHTS